MNYVLTCYPLSNKYRNEFERLVCPVREYLKLSELRHLKLRQIFQKLRSVKPGYLYLVFEDSNSITLLPILEIIALVIPSKKRIIVTPELIQKPFQRFRVIIDLIGLLMASLHGLLLVEKVKLELTRLLQASPEKALTLPVPRILFLKTNLWYGSMVGGSVGHVAGVVNGFNRLGFKVDLIAASPPEMIDESVIFHQIRSLRHYSLPYETNVYRFNKSFERQLLKMSFAKPGFIYQRLSIANYTGVLLSRKLRIPLVMEYNGSEVWIANKWGIPHRYQELALNSEIACLKHAHLIVVISEVLRDELIMRGFSSSKILSYPNCIDPAIFNPEGYPEQEKIELRNLYGIPKDAILTTFIGTFGNWHGVEILATAIRQMVDDDESWLKNNQLHFLLIGDGLKMPLVRNILVGERYQPYFTLTGLVPQKQAPLYLAASDILLSPHVANLDGSRFFGSPTKLFEYMAMGKGIVASDLEQIGQILKNSLRVGSFPQKPPDVNNQELAVLCKPGEVSELILGIRFLAENISWRIKLGENARNEVLAKYTWDRHVAAILAKVKQIGLERSDLGNL